MADLGLTPAFAGTPQAEFLSFLTDTFNSNLAAQLTAFDAMLSAEIVQFDTAASFARILADPLAYGFDNTTGTLTLPIWRAVCATPVIGTVGCSGTACILRPPLTSCWQVSLRWPYQSRHRWRC